MPWIFCPDHNGAVGRRRLSRSRASSAAIALAIPVVIHGIRLMLARPGIEGAELRATVPALWDWLAVLVWDPMVLAYT